MTGKARSPNSRGTQPRQIRMEKDLWDDFGQVAEPDRSAVLRDFVRWYVREPGAKMPRRPDPKPDDQADSES